MPVNGMPTSDLFSAMPVMAQQVGGAPNPDSLTPGHQQQQQPPPQQLQPGQQSPTILPGHATPHAAESPLLSGLPQPSLPQMLLDQVGSAPEPPQVRFKRRPRPRAPSIYQQTHPHYDTTSIPSEPQNHPCPPPPPLRSDVYLPPHQSACGGMAGGLPRKRSAAMLVDDANTTTIQDEQLPGWCATGDGREKDHGPRVIVGEGCGVVDERFG